MDISQKVNFEGECTPYVDEFRAYYFDSSLPIWMLLSILAMSHSSQGSIWPPPCLPFLPSLIWPLLYIQLWKVCPASVWVVFWVIYTDVSVTQLYPWNEVSFRSSYSAISQGDRKHQEVPVFSYFSDKYPEGEQLACVVVLFLTFHYVQII